MQLALPEETKKLLLHACCAPCSGGIIERLREAGANFTVFFYNPNIVPREEYEKRKTHNKNFAAKLGVPFVDADYDNERWLARARGLENEPERGRRCTECFAMRLERAAQYAHENGFNLLATSLGISRWKDLDQVNACGQRAAERYKGLRFWDINWRKQGGAERSALVARRENFYRQNYCGCQYSRQACETRNKSASE